MKNVFILTTTILALAIACGPRPAPETAKATPTPEIVTEAPVTAPKEEAVPATPPPVKETPPLDLGKPTAAEILKEVKSAYANLKSYTSEGESVTEMDMSGFDFGKLPGASNTNPDELAAATPKGVQHVTNAFSMKLGHPDRYVVEWSADVGPGAGASKQKGVVWSDGSGDCISLRAGEFSKLPNRMMALASATGVSGGVAGNIPSLFFKGGIGPLNSVEDGTRHPDEPIGDDLCHVVEISVQGIIRIRYWIDPQSWTIRRSQQRVGSDIGKLMASMMKNLPAEAGAGKSAVTAGKAMDAMAGMKSDIVITESHREIRLNPELQDADFKPALANSAKQVPSPLEQFQNAPKPEGK